MLPECARGKGRVWRLLVSRARAARTEEARAARWSLVLAQRPHRNDRMSTLRAVRVEARTFETNRATLKEDARASLERLSKTRAVGDQSASIPADGNQQAWKDYLNMEWSTGAVGATWVSFPCKQQASLEGASIGQCSLHARKRRPIGSPSEEDIRASLEGLSHAPSGTAGAGGTT